MAATDMDIQITKHHNRDKLNVCGVSPAGTAWIFANMGSTLSSVIVVDAEAIDELKRIMTKDGLIVQD